MNKLKIGKELNTYVRSINKHFNVVYDSDLTLTCGIVRIVWFNNFDKYSVEMQTNNLEKSDYPLIVKTGIINKFYCKAIELFNQYGPKYTIQITKDGNNYLHANKCKDYKDVYFDVLVSSSVWINEFTQAQIEEFKKRDDLAIDWDKAIIKEVK